MCGSDSFRRHIDKGRVYESRRNRVQAKGRLQSVIGWFTYTVNGTIKQNQTLIWNKQGPRRLWPAISGVLELQPNQWHFWIAETFQLSEYAIDFGPGFIQKIPEHAVGEN